MRIFSRVGERAARIPIKALQTLMTAGYHRIHSWDSGLGETRSEVERNLPQMPEVEDQLGKSGEGHTGVARVSHKRTEMAFILSVWEELQTDVKVRRECKAKNKQMT